MYGFFVAYSTVMGIGAVLGIILLVIFLVGWLFARVASDVFGFVASEARDHQQWKAEGENDDVARERAARAAAREQSRIAAQQEMTRALETEFNAPSLLDQWKAAYEAASPEKRRIMIVAAIMGVAVVVTVLFLIGYAICSSPNVHWPTTG